MCSSPDLHLSSYTDCYKQKQSSSKWNTPAFCSKSPNFLCRSNTLARVSFSCLVWRGGEEGTSEHDMGPSKFYYIRPFLSTTYLLTYVPHQYTFYIKSPLSHEVRILHDYRSHNVPRPPWSQAMNHRRCGLVQLQSRMSYQNVCTLI